MVTDSDFEHIDHIYGQRIKYIRCDEGGSLAQIMAGRTTKSSVPNIGPYTFLKINKHDANLGRKIQNITASVWQLPQSLEEKKSYLTKAMDEIERTGGVIVISGGTEDPELKAIEIDILAQHPGKVAFMNEITIENQEESLNELVQTVQALENKLVHHENEKEIVRQGTPRKTLFQRFKNLFIKSGVPRQIRPNTFYNPTFVDSTSEEASTKSHEKEPQDPGTGPGPGPARH